LKLRQPIR